MFDNDNDNDYRPSFYAYLFFVATCSSLLLQTAASRESPLAGSNNAPVTSAALSANSDLSTHDEERLASRERNPDEIPILEPKKLEDSRRPGWRTYPRQLESKWTLKKVKVEGEGAERGMGAVCCLAYAQSRQLSMRSV
ncbi:hypothetical protein CVT26_008989 [Gymnopilus dilepis]|uniref:Uncharacterized protein n=1 Tax=Gymnopilus dilepis TaxID=231916 RepID=A0A409WCU9_9AGAR|nr:hypothetical protein CVT26_008989 [Gymnopilus dilepis]